MLFRSDVYLVKPASDHAKAYGFGAALMRLGEVTHAQLTLLGITRVAVLSQPRMPVPHFGAQSGVVVTFVMQANFGDAMDLTQALVKFDRRGLPKSSLQRLQDGIGREAVAARSSHRNDERPAKSVQVLLVEIGQLLGLFGGGLPQPGSLLLLAGFAREAFGRLGGEHRVRLDQGQLLVVRGLGDAVGKHPFQMRQAAKRALRQCGLRNPRAVFVNAVQPCLSFLGRGLVEPIQDAGGFVAHGCDFQGDVLGVCRYTDSTINHCVHREPAHTMGLSTHVLDTMHGCPAAGMAVSLYDTFDGTPRLLRSLVLNADGRSDGPLLDHQTLKVGTYRLVFSVKPYFQTKGVALPEPSFLNEVSLDFGVADAQAHYHVPLLVSPWSYATYRGS